MAWSWRGLALGARAFTKSNHAFPPPRVDLIHLRPGNARENRGDVSLFAYRDNLYRPMVVALPGTASRSYPFG
jgi:hypothetical protein